jgi:CHAD domain-containing protein
MAERPLRHFAQRIVERRLRKLLRCAKRALSTGRDDDLHATRIAVKRLRYNLEFFAGILGAECLPALEQLALVQERLGTIADADAFARFYDDLADHFPEGDSRLPGVRALRETARLERERAIESLRALWTGADQTPYPELLAASISSALSSLSPKDDS